MSRVQLALLLCVVLIFSMGLLMVFNTTAAEVLDRSLDRSTHHALFRQILYAVFGMAIAVGFWLVGYQNVVKLSGPLLILASFLLFLVFIPGVGQEINGARRWIGFFGYSFQPSEFVKYLIPLYYIQVMTTREGPFQLRGFLKLLGLLAIPMGLILVEPDNGTTAIILASLVVLFVLTRLRWVFWALPLMVFIAVGGLVAMQMPHVSDRIQIYLHPELDLQGKGHQPYQAKIAAGSGKLWGKGLAESLQKMDYLPEARSDYIAAIYAEEFGFIGMMVLIVLYLLFGFFGFYLAGQTKDPVGFYLVSIFTFLVCFQAFLNLGVVSGLLPSKGTNLPFFSQGGSSLIANCMAVSLMLNVGRKSCTNPVS